MLQSFGCAADTGSHHKHAISYHHGLRLQQFKPARSALLYVFYTGLHYQDGAE